jgi:hypothetical protein
MRVVNCYWVGCEGGEFVDWGVILGWVPSQGCNLIAWAGCGNVNGTQDLEFWGVTCSLAWI